jgi:hypothetical protein
VRDAEGRGRPTISASAGGVLITGPLTDIVPSMVSKGSDCNTNTEMWASAAENRPSGDPGVDRVGGRRAASRRSVWKSCPSTIADG